MTVTIALALALLPGSVRADPASPHVTAVAVARAQILSGVRIEQAPQAAVSKRERREAPLPRPRERPCPEREATPCRLMILDMP